MSDALEATLGLVCLVFLATNELLRVKHFWRHHIPMNES